MKKFIYNSMMLLTLGGLMTACSSDFLDTESKTDLNTGSFYKTEVQVEYAVVGCYDGYQRTVSNGSWPTLFQAAETMSDDCLGGGGPDDRSDRLMDRFDMTYKSDAVDLFDGIWGDYYKGIYRCNLLLGALDDVAWSDSINRIVAESEARAIRALEYFDLVRMFENVPLVLTPTSEIVAQSEPDEVYAQIVKDLKFVADNMPASKYTNESDFGRITKYAAEAMLARVYLFYDGVYGNNAGADMPGELTKAQAFDYCKDVIENGGYSLEPTFANLWPAASTTASEVSEGWINTYNETSKEIIWVVKFNNDQDWNNDNINSNRFIVNFGMRNVSTYAPYGNGWGACPITPYANSLFSADDTRGAATVINTRTVGAYDEQIATDCMDYTGYVNMKYCPLIYKDGTSIPTNAAASEISGANFQTSQDQDWVLMRYADVLLMASELSADGEYAKARFNEVRERAYGSSSHNVSSAPSKDLIWKERRLEFMGEGIRYFDLRRQGMDAFVEAQMGQATSNGKSSGTAVSVYNNTVEETILDTYNESNIRAKRGFWQIPYTQISLSNNVYKQNAGW